MRKKTTGDRAGKRKERRKLGGLHRWQPHKNNRLHQQKAGATSNSHTCPDTTVTEENIKFQNKIKQELCKECIWAKQKKSCNTSEGKNSSYNQT